MPTPFVHFSVNYDLVDKPVVPENSEESRKMWRAINSSFAPVRGTPRTLLKAIKAGHPYTATHTKYRHKRYFIMGQTPSLDFDNGNSSSSFQHLLKDGFIVKNASFLYTTPSHTPETPRCRAVFVLEDPVKHAKLYADISRALVLRYDQSDQSCKDPARIFFGSKDCEVVWLGNRLAIKEIEQDLSRLASLDQANKERLKNVQVVELSNDGIKKNVERQLNAIASAPDGQRHLTRLKIGKLFGGWVAAGYFAPEKAMEMLMGAALENTSSPQEAVIRDLSTGLVNGMSQPVSMTPVTFADFGLDLL